MSSNSTEFDQVADKIVSLDIGNDDDDNDDGGPQIPPPPTNEEVKRGRGRPRKQEPPGVTRLEQAMRNQAPPMASVQPAVSDEDKDERKRKQSKISIIERLQSQLNAVGTGLRPTLFNSEQELDDEIDALNNDLNVKRADKAVKKLTLMFMPMIEIAADMFAPKDKLDLSTYRHLRDEVEENWEMFEEAAQHIAILHSGWFAVTPYHEFAGATYACAMSVNAKNQRMKLRAAAGGVLPTRAPQNSPEDDDDDEETTGDEDIDDK